MYRTHTCGELRINHKGEKVTLSGWIQRSRDLGGMTFIDIRDRYGITQLVFNMEMNSKLCDKARKLGREFVIRINGIVAERSNKNKKMPTGEIEILVNEFEVINPSVLPPFTIEDETDGGEDLRMKYRYLDLRRTCMRKNLELRHRMAQEVRKYMDSKGFIEIETPVLIKTTPEGARDFVVPSRMNQGQFYALPQSPQTFKQLLMVAGFDRYFQIVKCFRDEDLRADRQPEFTQIDCEMSFLDVEIKDAFPKLTYDEAMEKYGTDKPDMRFEMLIGDLTTMVRGKGFRVFDDAEYTGAICTSGCSEYSRKELDALTEFVMKPQIGGKGLIHVKVNNDGSFKSSVDKFYQPGDLKLLAEKLSAKPGDLLLLMAGNKKSTLKALSELRLEMGSRLGLRRNDIYKPLWVVDFPLLEWDPETKRYYAMHHPFTSPKLDDIEKFSTDPANVKANAYDLVINGIEIGGGSIRIHDEQLQQVMFRNLGLTEDDAREKFGFLMNAFRYGAPPHGGIAFGFDRWVALFAGLESIRDVIAFPKNNAGRDVMIDSPSSISEEQWKELGLRGIH
jgi:aspartyl-tRNA synthetase